MPSTWRLKQELWLVKNHRNAPKWGGSGKTDKQRTGGLSLVHQYPKWLFFYRSDTTSTLLFSPLFPPPFPRHFRSHLCFLLYLPRRLSLLPSLPAHLCLPCLLDSVARPFIHRMDLWQQPSTEQAQHRVHSAPRLQLAQVRRRRARLVLSILSRSKLLIALATSSLWSAWDPLLGGILISETGPLWLILIQSINVCACFLLSLSRNFCWDSMTTSFYTSSSLGLLPLSTHTTTFAAPTFKLSCHFQYMPKTVKGVYPSSDLMPNLSLHSVSWNIMYSSQPVCQHVCFLHRISSFIGLFNTYSAMHRRFLDSKCFTSDSDANHEVATAYDSFPTPWLLQLA